MFNDAIEAALQLTDFIYVLTRTQPRSLSLSWTAKVVLSTKMAYMIMSAGWNMLLVLYGMLISKYPNKKA